MEFSGTAEGARACRDQARMTGHCYATSIYHIYPGQEASPGPVSGEPHGLCGVSR